MKTILLCLFILTFAIFAPRARAQDDATQQQIDKLSGQIQDLQAALGQQDKRIGALEKQVSDLNDKLNQPGANNFASADDLKKLAGEVQEIDKKRQSDNEAILKELEKLDKALGVASAGRKSAPVATADKSAPTASGPQKGYDYTIAPGDTLSAIAKAYRAQGIKVTPTQIEAANPGLNPKSMVVGKKIFIPDPNAK